MRFRFLSFLFFICFSLTAEAAFSLSGTTITQSGTDTTNSFITSMQSMSGVTVSSHGNTNHSTFYIIDFGNMSLWIDGNFDLDFNRMQFIFSGTDATDRLYARNGSNFYMRSTQTQNGFTFNPEMGQILFAIENDTVNWNSRTLRVDPTANSEFIGVTFKGEFSTWLYGNTLVENCIIEKIGNTGDIQFNVQGNTTLRDIKMYASGQTGVTYRADSRNVITDNVQVFGARDSFNNESSFDVTVEKLNSDTGAIADISQFSAKRHIIKNAKNGTEFVWANHLNGGNPTNYSSGRIEVLQTVMPIGIDELGLGVPNFTFYMEDNPINGNVSTTMVSDSLTGNIKRVYNFTSNGVGIVNPFEVLIGAGQSNVDGQGLNGIIKTRGVNTTAGTQNTDDLYSWSAIEYGKNITNSNIILKGVNGTSVNVLFSVDNSITESDNSVVDSYPEIDDLDKLYDRAKAYLVDNYAGEIETILGGSGSLLDGRGYDLVIDNTAANAFDFDGTTITIKAGAMNCVGTNFTKFITTGTISFVNGSVPGTCLFTDSNGTNSILQLSGIPTGSFVYVEDDSGAQQDYQVGISGAYAFNIPSTATGTWTYVVKKEGYEAQVGGFEPTGGLFPFNVKLNQKVQPDGTVMYTASSSALIDVSFSGTSQLNIDIGDGIVSAQEVLDEVETALSTPAGMAWYAGGKSDVSMALLSAGNFIFVTDEIKFRRRSAGDVNATVNAFAISTQGVVTDGLNGAVTFLSSSQTEDIASAVWNRLLTDHVTPDTFGKLVQDIAGPGFDETKHSLSKQVDEMINRGILTTNTIKDLVD